MKTQCTILFYLKKLKQNNWSYYVLNPFYKMQVLSVFAFGVILFNITIQLRRSQC